MVCLAFHNPGNLALLVDREKYELVGVYSKEDEILIKEGSKIKSEKKKILFIASVDRLISYPNQKLLKKFKVVVFDSPQNFFKYQIRIDDGRAKSNGIWTCRSLTTENFGSILRKAKTGLGGKLDGITESERTWAKDKLNPIEKSTGKSKRTTRGKSNGKAA